MAFDLGSLLQKYVGGEAPTADTAAHFDQVARNASPDQVSNGLSAAFHSDATPSFGQLVGQLFGNANSGQQAGMLTNLLRGMGPSALSSLAAGAGGTGLGAILGNFLQQGGGNSAPQSHPNRHPS